MRAAGMIGRTAARAGIAACLGLAACGVLGAPPMEPLTAATLAAAEQRWIVEGADAYRLVVRVRAPRTDPVVYDVVVAGGRPVAIARDGQPMRPEDTGRYDYSMPGLFGLLHTDLRWSDLPAVGDTPAVDLRARFEAGTGRLVRYRRTVGTSRRRVLLVEVLSYEPQAAAPASASEEERRDG
jgi:hypothetical protein